MLHFEIRKPDDGIRLLLQEKIDNLTKPKGALGVLEELALQIGWIQQTPEPKLSNPCHIVFAGDHGIAAEGVSASPQEITYQMVANIREGGAGINFLARQHHFDLMLVDAGVNYDFKPDKRVVDMKIRKGTRNCLNEAAMTQDEMELAIQRGAACTQVCYDKGCNVIGFGEMGITNTSSSALWMAYLTGIPLEKCIGAGCDHTGAIVNHKYEVLKQVMSNYKGDASVTDVMRYFGGYEMVMATGAMLKAAELQTVILIDGFIMTNCVLLASRLYPEILNFCIFGHLSDETGHKLLLDYLGVKPILNLGLRLGEGTGALCAYPVVDSAVRMINEMNTFKSVQVTKYF